MSENEQPKQICPECQAELAPEPMTREGMAPLLEMIRSCELVARNLGDGMTTARVFEVQIELALRMTNAETIGDLMSIIRNPVEEEIH